MGELDVAGYLARLGLTDAGPPSISNLTVLHRAQVERVPYENIDIQLGRPTTVDPYAAARRIMDSRRGGYCFHVNGAFAVLLQALGYDVRWHVGGVQGRHDPGPVGPTGNHLALTVHGLPAPDCPDGVWMVDAGLGDGPHEPMPLRAGVYRQGPFGYRLRPSDVIPGGWRFEHDPCGAFAGMDFGPGEARPADFAARHEWLSTNPESGFVRLLVVCRRDADGVDVLRGRVLSRWDGAGRRDATLTAFSDWSAALADVFGITLSTRERQALWRRTA